MADFPAHPLRAVTVLEVTVQLDCGCGKVTVLTFPGDAIGETGRSYTCTGCGSSHWFSLAAEATGEDDDG